MGLQADVKDGLLCLKDNREELLIFEYLYYHLENVSDQRLEVSLSSLLMTFVT